MAKSFKQVTDKSLNTPIPIHKLVYDHLLGETLVASLNEICTLNSIHYNQKLTTSFIYKNSTYGTTIEFVPPRQLAKKYHNTMDSLLEHNYMLSNNDQLIKYFKALFVITPSEDYLKYTTIPYIVNLVNNIHPSVKYKYPFFNESFTVPATTCICDAFRKNSIKYELLLKKYIFYNNFLK